MKKQTKKFTEGEIAAYIELGEILRRIQSRLVSEGVDFEKTKQAYYRSRNRK